ncbi:PAC2 family protein [Egicoccus sp. AB-alg6-2]|uniref:PAC2 family protein n=1 Tax=Egicoccus sp. AB-alg6-2 TaxID=3242692 RepID=UPI00359DDC26
MELLRLDPATDDLGPDPVLVLSFDGWTDAGEGGTAAADALRQVADPIRIGSFDGDALYDYRDRRPQLSIDRGVLAQPVWPELTVEALRPSSGPALILVTGAEPDLAWQKLGRDLVALARHFGATRYVGLGAVPGPIPHTRPVQVLATSNDLQLLERMGRPHEPLVVPSSCQSAMEALLASAGITTLGLWARIPHYIAGDYPDGARALLERFTGYLGTPVDLSQFDEAASDNRAKLDLAAASSEEVTEHVRQLERLYDAEVEAERLAEGGTSGSELSEVPVPSADELAAEIERFLSGRTE